MRPSTATRPAPTCGNRVTTVVVETGQSGYDFRFADATKAADAYALRYEWAKKPMLITEWSFPALDAGLPC